jgi:hypothetical protein
VVCIGESFGALKRMSQNVNASPPPCNRAGVPPLPAHSLTLVRGRYRPQECGIRLPASSVL